MLHKAPKNRKKTFPHMIQEDAKTFPDFHKEDAPKWQYIQTNIS